MRNTVIFILFVVGILALSACSQAADYYGADAVGFVRSKTSEAYTASSEGSVDDFHFDEGEPFSAGITGTLVFNGADFEDGENEENATLGLILDNASARYAVTGFNDGISLHLAFDGDADSGVIYRSPKVNPPPAGTTHLTFWAIGEAVTKKPYVQFSANENGIAVGRPDPGAPLTNNNTNNPAEGVMETHFSGAATSNTGLRLGIWTKFLAAFNNGNSSNGLTASEFVTSGDGTWGSKMLYFRLTGGQQTIDMYFDEFRWESISP